MSADERTGWECRFCFEKLKPQPLIGWRRLLWIVPVRAFRCPHCFNLFQKPAAMIAAIPFVGKLFCSKRGVSGSVSEMISTVARRGKNSRRNYVDEGWFVSSGRWIENAESKASQFLGKSFRTLGRHVLWPFHWFSGKFLRSRGKSLLSHGSRSKSRSRSHSSDEA